MIAPPSPSSPIETVSNMRDIVARGLDNALPENAHDILNKREGRVTIGVTELFPRPKGIFVSEFSSKEDLIEVLLGSW